jgi:hypothetical protein
LLGENLVPAANEKEADEALDLSGDLGIALPTAVLNLQMLQSGAVSKGKLADFAGIDPAPRSGPYIWRLGSPLNLKAMPAGLTKQSTRQLSPRSPAFRSRR